MFSAWGGLVYRHRRLAAVVSVVLAAISFPLAGQASGELSSGGWLVSGSESAQVTERLASQFDQGRSSLIVLIRTDGAQASSAAVQDAVEASIATMRSDPRVRGIVDYRAAGNDPRLVSTDGTETYVVVELQSTNEGSINDVEPLRALIQHQPGLTYLLTGYGPLARDANVQSQQDLERAEIVSLPLALVILTIVFGSLLAAGLPLLVAGLTIPTTAGLIYLIAQHTEMSIYVINVATMLGLALAIDYSLFLVSRFREELRRGRSVEDAVQIAVGTAGKAVTFSGIAVAIGLLGLLFFVSPAISSIGIAGSIVVACSVVYGLTFLPAVLGMLGPRVNAWSAAGGLDMLRRRVGLAPPPERKSGTRWERIARGVMRHPVLVLIPTLIILLATGTPFLRLNQAVPDASVLPAGRESRDAYVYLRDDFPGRGTSPFIVLADVQGDPRSEANIQALMDYADRLARVPEVTSIESPIRSPLLLDPATGAPLDASHVAQLLNAQISTLPPGYQQLRGSLDTYINGSTAKLDVYTTANAATTEGLNVTTELRDVAPGAGISAKVGGYIAGNFDTLTSMRERTPWAVSITMLVSAVVLFLLFGSVVLPVKAVFMTLLSITASFGALVWIFQDGNVHGFLNFVPLGYTPAGNPIIMFAVIFGLSMDYEVLLLSRIQEAYRRTGDNTASVAEGLARTAGVITGAALIMVTVFSAFALADIIIIKSIGVGMAVAVFIDATLIRILVVPATMRLLGRWNWWAPGPLGRLADRLGFSHVEAEAAEALPT